MNPAKMIIGRLGGEAQVAFITGTAYTAPYRWQAAKWKGGTGGLIPQRYHRTLLDYARSRRASPWTRRSSCRRRRTSARLYRGDPNGPVRSVLTGIRVETRTPVTWKSTSGSTTSVRLENGYRTNPMSIANSLHRAHKARLARFASRAVPQADLRKARRCLRPRSVMDRDYERAWAVAILGWVPQERPSARRSRGSRTSSTRRRSTSASRARHACVKIARARWSRPRQVAMFLAERTDDEGLCRNRRVLWRP